MVYRLGVANLGRPGTAYYRYSGGSWAITAEKYWYAAPTVSGEPGEYGRGFPSGVFSALERNARVLFYGKGRL